MPADNPQYGELWSLNDAGDREVLAIVSDTSANMYTMISLTGQRMRFPVGGRYRWTFERAINPLTGVLCERHGCSNTGFLRYTAPIGFGYACPRHVPMGLEYTIQESADGIPNQGNWRAPVHALPCPNPDCPNTDPIEDPSQLHLGIETLHRFWTCTLCSRQWMDTSNLTIASADLAQTHADLTIGMLAAIRSARHEPERILFPTPTWGILNAATLLTDEDNIPLFEGVPCQINPDIMSTVIHLRRNVRRPVQRLGGQPNRTTGQTPRSVQDQLKKDLSLADELTPILDGTYWAQRRIGDIIQVVRTEQIPSANNARTSETMVIIKQLRDAHNPTVPLTRKDFLRIYIPHTEREPEIIELPQVAVGEEWVSVQGDTIKIVGADARKEVVIAHRTKDDGTTENIRLPFEQFFESAQIWRKFTRRSAYERLWDDDL